MLLKKWKMKMTNTRVIAISFAVVILVGTLLLCTPWASATGEWTPVVDAMFTATTSTCVTGLVVYDTSAHWSLFGQIVILVLIQVGGIGFMTLMTLFSFFVHHKVSLHERRMLLQSVGSLQMSGVMSAFRQILLGTFVVEGIGAALLSVRFYPMFGKKGIWYAVFHSVSAFCNAGIDLLGNTGSASFSAYYNDPLIICTLMFLIIMGGLGFLVWSDLLRGLFCRKKLRLHSKLVLSITAVLIFGGWGLLYLTERNASLAGMCEGDKLLTALFQSVTTRTAGFATVDQSTLSDSGSVISMVLMLVGGSPGSTAGGIKTTTVAVFFLSILRLCRNREDVTVYKKRIEDRVVRQAGAIVGVYLLVALVATVLISALEGAGLREVLYEVVSAIATVGLSMNLTPTLCLWSKMILILLMYAGRLGGLSLFLALAESGERQVLTRPTEDILIG